MALSNREIGSSEREDRRNAVRSWSMYHNICSCFVWGVVLPGRDHSNQNQHSTGIWRIDAYLLLRWSKRGPTNAPTNGFREAKDWLGPRVMIEQGAPQQHQATIFVWFQSLVACFLNLNDISQTRITKPKRLCGGSPSPAARHYPPAPIELGGPGRQKASPLLKFDAGALQRRSRAQKRQWTEGSPGTLKRS